MDLENLEPKPVPESTPVEKKQKHPVQPISKKSAVRNSILFTLIAAAGVIAGLAFKNPLIIIIGLLPAAIYEVIRTEGISTKAASIILIIVLAAELVLIIARINFDVAKFFNISSKYIGGYSVPLGDIKIVGAAVLAVLSVILFLRTAGPYTKWLSIVIFVSSFAIIYTIAPGQFQNLLKWGIDQGLRLIHF